tara:strand:- start:810 stop:1673 length:864 start_codon:yes stop_codon:yes gene_type:complete
MSFNWTMLFREGSWLEFRSFALKQRQNVQLRFDTIQYELSRIGNVSITYQRDPNNELKMTERRLGINVKKNTSLGKLIQAYVAKGGNYFDISMFLKPDSYSVVEVESDDGIVGEIKEMQPYTGVISPSSGNAISDRVDTTGVTDVWRDPARKLGDKGTLWDDDSTKLVGDRIIAARSWIQQEIKELRNDLEARIIKLCDLREQLLIERNEIVVSAIGGTTPGTTFDTEAFLSDLHLSHIVFALDTDFYETKEDGTADFTKPRQGRGTKEFPNLLEDAPSGEEKYTAL